MIKDQIIKKVVEKITSRSEVGIQKYGTTLDRDDLTLLDWLNHLQEELMDACGYIEKIIALIEEKVRNNSLSLCFRKTVNNNIFK